MPCELNFNYYTSETFNNDNDNDIIECFNGKNSFSALNCNIRSLSANFDNLVNLLSELAFTFSLIGLTETKIKLNQDPIVNITLSGYHYLSQKLNKLTVFDPEPMPAAIDLFQKLNGDKFFSKIDLSKGYWRVTIPEVDIPKTAFVTPDGSYEFLKMPFGMVNSAATLKRGMKKLLKGMKNVEFDWDDILVHTRTWEDHLKILRKLFRHLAQAGMTIRPSKCIFGVDSIDLLSHQLQQGLIGLHEDNVAKIRKASRPTTKKQVGSFMGLAGYYRDFIPNFAAVAAPLSDLTRKGQPSKVEWGDAQEKAYRTIKILPTSDPILRLPDPEKTFVLRTDASNYGIGAVLIQEHGGKLFSICYVSKKLSDAELNYSTIEKECLVVVWGIKRFHMHLYGVRFVLQTDHEPLKYMNSAKFTNNRLMR